jgi:hypothetical protein
MPAGYADYSLDQSGVLNVVNGGTGQAALTQNAVLLGNGGGPVLSTAAGTARQNFQIPAGGGAPQFQEAEFNKADIYPTVQGGGLTVHGTTTPVLAPAVVLRDDTAGLARGSLGFAAQTGQYFSDMLVGDFALRADNNTLRLGTASGASTLQILSGGTVGITNTLASYNGRATAGVGIPTVVATYVNGGLTGATSYTVTLVASTPTFTWYRVSGYLMIIPGVAGGTMSLTLNFNNGVAQSLAFSPGVAGTSGGNFSQGSTFVRCASGTAVTLTITTGNAAGTYVCVAIVELVGTG